ncbi:MAG: glycosyltransferase [Bacteroidales bacterium]|nr:glycosyltransferase [Bacteroidales bacterium]
MKLFFLLARVPYPTEKGDKLRAFHQITHLAKHHEIIICALNEGVLHEDAVPVLSKYASAIHIIPISKSTIISNIAQALFTGKPLQVGYYYNKSTKKIIHALIKKYKPDHIFCQLIRMAEYVKELPVPKTLDYQDVFSKGVERRLASSSLFLRPFLKLEYQRMLDSERKAFDLFDNKIIISYPDRDLIPHPEKEKIVVVANGVDTSFFHPLERDKEYDLVFTGNMSYPPNVHSCEFLVNKIIPRVLEKKPDLNVLIAGANPTMRVMVLRSPQIEVSGWVPDIREAYARAKIFIAPMQLGTGLQNKLLEAMAMKIPCITSPLANEALTARVGEEILVGETPQDYADHIIELLDNEKLAAGIAEQGYQFVLKNYSWEAETDKIEALISGK